MVPPQFEPRIAAPVIKAVGIAWIRLGRRDPATAERYFTDFGLRVAARTETALYFRGVLPQHHCLIVETAPHDVLLGFGLHAGSVADLALLAAAHDVPIEASLEPGGGSVVRMRDPAGLAVEIVHGLAELPELPHRPARVLNGPGDHRRVNAPQPALAGPAEVFRLGHLALQRQELVKNTRWYMRNFGLIASDVEILPESHDPVLVFMRCDLGATPADHHSVVIAAGPRDAFDHAAFETLDLDAVALGGEWLQRQGWVQSWGVGRHVLGSQIFNYHFDPSGFSVEHYADGDMLDASYPTRFHPAGKAGIYQWGPTMPDHFIDTAPSLPLLADVVRGLHTRPEFTLARLAETKRTFDLPARLWVGRRFRKPRPA
jgi:catechol 2,3-dioxygenase-like lactoylglutathione lyase family enzyme